MTVTSRYDRVIRGAAKDGAFYRLRPDKFARDYLHVDLRLFQKVLIIMMNLCSIVVFTGSRGIGC